MLDDYAIDTLHSALSGLSARQRAISDNIANVNTPYFQARSVAFEGDLRRALDDGDNVNTLRDNLVVSQAAPGLTENNVNLAEETMAAIKTQMSYNLMLRATGDRFTLLKTAVR